MTQSKNTSTTSPLLETPPSSPARHKPAMTAASVLNKMQNDEGGFYAATPKLAYRAEYFSGGQKGNILIVKGRNLNEDAEFIIHGVFEISRNNFYFTPDANFNPTNVFQGRFADVKLNCKLMAGHSEAFKFPSDDFSAILNNIRAFKKLVPKERDYETVNIIHDSLGHRSIKLTHSLFKAKADDLEADANDEGDGNGKGSTTTAESLSSEYNMASWPVSDRCKGHLHELVSSHNIQPLPTYDENHKLIPPSQYESKLKGALVEVHMAICHHRIKSSRHDIFNAVLQEIIVLAPPAAMPTSPFKRRLPQ
ncbi:uncharacterized protein EDB93DRAFT_1102872 [Suillus bovinus]|uniref:uncharacterized protein n=1 Tax=Suillus bovinus TaxID=48563 RepID=UPI001B867BD4|nr:uncharacterized protein EDB93DRAFT_1102872 [Suillus bovinus]KAG2153133.1 hypothetical protein EDB93DRAFT_1102872 [Suillus bovinus]